MEFKLVSEGWVWTCSPNRAHNSIFDYDLIAINETSLNDSVVIPDPLLNDYKFESVNSPANTRHGGVGIFYKNSLPLVILKGLSCEESIVAELKFGRKKNIFYRLISKSFF